MREHRFYFKAVLAKILIGFLFLISVKAQSPIVKSAQTLLLGETAVRINVYEKKGSPITFVAPHFNEQVGTKIVEELIEKSGGRLIEIDSSDENGIRTRRLKFKYRGRNYDVDPNRIFTENGRECGDFSPEANSVIKIFAANLLKIILPAGGQKLSGEEKFLVAVHNNADAGEAKNGSAKTGDLTAYAFAGYDKNPAFSEQVEGVYLSNTETDADNFFFLSAPNYLNFFAAKGFNVVVQKSAAKLQSKNCAVDDGSLSVFASQQNIPYINVEADITSGSVRQRQMIESVYELLNILNKPASTAATTDKSSEVNKL